MYIQTVAFVTAGRNIFNLDFSSILSLYHTELSCMQNSKTCRNNIYLVKYDTKHGHFWINCHIYKQLFHKSGHLLDIKISTEA